jgi:hypothetical protein
MKWTRGLVGPILSPRYSITSITCNGSLFSLINECHETVASAEVNLVNFILRMNISTGEEKRSAMRLFLAEGQKRFEIDHSSSFSFRMMQ